MDFTSFREGLFESFKELIEIHVGQDRVMVPENNKVLRCLQFVKMETITYGDYCWNGECTNCQIWYRTDEGELKSALACRLYVEPGLKITGLSDSLKADLAG